MANERHRKDEERKREADAALRRVERDSETFGTSTMARVGKQARDHFSGADADTDDWAEIWGRRIGRGAGLIVMLFLVYYLVTTYILPT